MNVKAKIAGVQLECALFRWNHVKALFALFAKYVKGCGFYVHVSDVHLALLQKKNWRWRREMTINDLFRFERGKNEFETGKKIKKIMWSRSTYKWLRKGSVLLMVHH
jgi:hypothetical protein